MHENISREVEPRTARVMDLARFWTVNHSDLQICLRSAGIARPTVSKEDFWSLCFVWQSLIEAEIFAAKLDPQSNRTIQHSGLC